MGGIGSIQPSKRTRSSDRDWKMFIPLVINEDFLARNPDIEKLRKYLGFTTFYRAAVYGEFCSRPIGVDSHLVLRAKLANPSLDYFG
jgi:hypothetical protein